MGDALIVICSAHMKMKNVNATNDILSNIIEQCFDLQSDVSIQHLIFLHRCAIECGNQSLVETIGRILEQKDKQNKIKSNVICYFAMNGQTHSVSTGYAFDDAIECEFDSRRAVDDLMKKIHYKMDTSQCTELPSKFAKQNHLKSHSEKKALAVLLANGEKNIKIKVSMRMCQDCHQFFEQVSKYYNQHRIECVDHRGNHLFLQGKCQLCNS